MKNINSFGLNLNAKSFQTNAGKVFRAWSVSSKSKGTLRLWGI
jgi:hypothetical protein